MPARAGAGDARNHLLGGDRPDDTVTIRVARSEMGQGAMTGLAMLVAEELECDWAKVRTEFVSPELNTARNRVWGDMSTGASRSIATSQQYLRQAGAAARRDADRGRRGTVERGGLAMHRATTARSRMPQAAVR